MVAASFASHTTSLNAPSSGIAEVSSSISADVEYSHSLIEIEALEGSESHEAVKSFEALDKNPFFRKKRLFLPIQRPPFVAPSIRPASIQKSSEMVMLFG